MIRVDVLCIVQMATSLRNLKCYLSFYKMPFYCKQNNALPRYVNILIPNPCCVTRQRGIKVTDPTKSVNYVTCHDNYTLYDRLKAAGESNAQTIKKQAMLANACVFTSQGITFMLAGEEMLRTKGGDSNSYQSSYQVNDPGTITFVLVL